MPEVAPEDSSDTPDDPVGWTIPRNEDNDESGVWSVGASMCGGVEARTGAPCFRLDPPPGWAVSSRAAGAAGRVNHDSVTVYYNHIIFDFYFKKVRFYFAHKMFSIVRKSYSTFIIKDQAELEDHIQDHRFHSCSCSCSCICCRFCCSICCCICCCSCCK